MVHLILILTLPLHEKRTPYGVLFSLSKQNYLIKQQIPPQKLILSITDAFLGLSNTQRNTLKR